MIDDIRQKVCNIITGKGKEEIDEEQRVLIIERGNGSSDVDLRAIGLFTDISEEKVAEVVQGLLFLHETNKPLPEEEKLPIEFYLSTYGGNADDMFALYDMMRMIEQETPIHTVGVGKVMSAGVLLLAAGTKGQRRIMQNCRVMIHSVSAGNHGDLHDLVNEIEALQDLQEMYVNCLVQETKMTKSALKKMLERKVNVYLSAEKAVELGIADIIV
jgi:ATP-dependent Clp protease protease subunit